MADLFDELEVADDGKKRGVPGSTIVKTKAITLTSQIMAKIPQGDAEFLEQIKLSQTSVSAMDDLVKSECAEQLHDDDVAQFGQDEAQRLLKSNQSNRSRRKSLPMTQSNYVELLTAAVAEWIIRESCDMEKSHRGFGAVHEAMDINESTVAELAKDQDALGKAIRNVQSKKSSYKAKHADDPSYVEDDAWQELLQQEAMLKGARQTQPAARKGVSFKKALQFIFMDVANVDELGKDDSHAILEACKQLSTGIYPTDYLAAVEKKQAEAAAKSQEEAALEATDESEVESDVYAQ